MLVTILREHMSYLASPHITFDYLVITPGIFETFKKFLCFHKTCNRVVTIGAEYEGIYGKIYFFKIQHVTINHYAISKYDCRYIIRWFP